MNKKILPAIIIVLILSALLVLLISNNWSLRKTIKNKTENNSKYCDEIILNDEKITEQNFVSKYLENNISELSPEKEVLGGKFFITSIDFICNNEAIISYEDGHIALRANVDFSVKQNDLHEMEVTINEFNILND